MKYGVLMATLCLFAIMPLAANGESGLQFFATKNVVATSMSDGELAQIEGQAAEVFSCPTGCTVTGTGGGIGIVSAGGHVVVVDTANKDRVVIVEGPGSVPPLSSVRVVPNAQTVTVSN